MVRKPIPWWGGESPELILQMDSGNYLEGPFQPKSQTQAVPPDDFQALPLPTQRLCLAVTLLFLPWSLTLPENKVVRLCVAGRDGRMVADLQF